MVKKQILKNGLTLITAPLKETKVVTILVLFGIGSRFETRRIRGLSHFIEHMMFKGTKKRLTAQILVREIDALGAVYNAFTGKDMTGYYIKVDQSHLATAVEILSDMLQNSLIDNREMQREKNVIIEEINMREDTPLIHVEDVFEEVLFGDQPVGWDTAGTRDSIKKMRRQDFVNYIKRYYTTGNAVVVITGDVDHDQAAKLVTDNFKSLPAKSRAHPRKTNFGPTKRKAELIHRPSEQSHLVIGFPSFPYCHPRLSALKVLHTALGGNMSSRLFHVIRDKHGLAYYVRSAINSYADTGTFVVQAGLDNKRLEKAVKLIVRELQKLTMTAVGKNELKRAKDFLKGQIAIQLEDQENLADWLARRYLFEHKLISVDDYLADIEKVTARDVRIVAQEIFKASKINLAMIGPFNDKAKILKLLNF